MPYKRTYRKRTSRRRPAGGAGRATNARIAKVAKRVVMRAAETKLHCATMASYSLASDAGTIQNAFMRVPQGDTIDSRDGDVIAPTHLQIRGVLKSAAAVVSSIIRVMVFKASDNATNPYSSNMPTVYGCVTPAFTAGTERIVYDRLFTLSNALGGGADTRKVIDLKFPMSGKLRYADGSASDPPKHNWVVWITSDRNAASGVAPTAQFETVFKYKDV